MTLGALFDAPLAHHLVFNGGTLVSKALPAIRRPSEDINITYDMRAFAPGLNGVAGLETIPPTRS